MKAGGSIRRRGLLVLFCVVLLLAGCRASVYRLGMALFYEEAELAQERIHRDLAYWQNDPEKHRLDLFVPGGRGWPTLIFVHGGGWTQGDKAERVGGADIYANVGRFYAARGMGVAVINYRLQPRVEWHEQVLDVARATAWVHDHIDAYGGDPSHLALAGHSAGAHLAARAVVDAELLRRLGVPRRAICGVVPVSGAGYDMADPETYALGAKRSWYEERFRTGPEDDAWQHEASVLPLVRPGLPPFLLLYSSREWKSLAHQNRLLREALERAGVAAELIEIAGESHGRMMLAMTREGSLVSEAALDFLARVCGIGRSTAALPAAQPISREPVRRARHP